MDPPVIAYSFSLILERALEYLVPKPLTLHYKLFLLKCFFNVEISFICSASGVKMIKSSCSFTSFFGTVGPIYKRYALPFLIHYPASYALSSKAPKIKTQNPNNLFKLHYCTQTRIQCFPARTSKTFIEKFEPWLCFLPSHSM